MTRLRVVRMMALTLMLVRPVTAQQPPNFVFLSDNGATFLKICDDGTSPIAGRWFNGRLFNLLRDPGEPNDLSQREPAVAARLDSTRRVEDQRTVHPSHPSKN